MPKYYFKVEIMMAHNGVRQRTTANGRWLPPKALGHNIKWQQPGVSTPVFYHDGHATGPKNLPCNAREYKVYSIYHDQAVFWTVDYDATRKPVADGQDFDAANGGDRHPNDESDSESSSDDEELDDWRPLSFNPLEGNTQLISYAGRRLQSRTLLVQRPDQTWVPQCAGWLPKRGLVVTVYYDPEETKEEELQSYEDGDDGPIFA
ncbi:hypothetical protein B0A50_06381 [Salinomyces thailandicus]|uniref:Uncharacterized protein n=1 Tax=Salinomyces thailandicus TaxID=706561 RepID=A0A4U0TR37_9PEZI|nr:hypothetical protein B0A50_06381 [Salinomyces thailandica]